MSGDARDYRTIRNKARAKAIASGHSEVFADKYATLIADKKSEGFAKIYAALIADGKNEGVAKADAYAYVSAGGVGIVVLALLGLLWLSSS